MAQAPAPSTPAAQAAAARLAGMKPPSVAAPPAMAAEPEAQKKGKGNKADGEGGKKKLPIKAILAVVLLLGVGYVVKGKVMKPHYGPGVAVPLGATVDLGQITTNLSDGHLAQVDVVLQLTKPANSKLVTKDEPQFTGDVVADLGHDTYVGLLSPAGRAGLEAELLHQFQAALGLSEGAQQVQSVFFTSFVLQ